MKILLWLWAAGPLVQLTYYTFTNQLGSNPQEYLLRALGQQSLMLLAVVIALPLIARYTSNTLLQSRRMLGLWVFAYATLHLLAFLFFEHNWDLQALEDDFLRRPFVTVGLSAWLLLLPLALTSNRWSMRLLKADWKRLHRFVWLILALSIAHYFLHKAGKNDYAMPALWAAVGTGLLWARLRR